jgi:hypothetical protein
MTSRTEQLCRDLVKCIDGLIVEHVRLFPASTPAAVADIDHARKELGEVVESLICEAICEAIREAVEP